MKENKKSFRIPTMAETFSFPTIVAMTVVFTIIAGIISSEINIIYSQVTQGVTDELIIKMIVLFVCYAVNNGLYRESTKTMRNLKMNDSFVKLFDRVSNSKLSDLTQIASGEIFNITYEIADKESSIYCSTIGCIPCIIPFFTLIWKEWQIRPLSAIISLAAVLINIIMSLFANKYFHFTSDVKAKKNKLQSITVDNFMNIKALKYMHGIQFARQRLINAQNDVTPYFINRKQVWYFRLADLIIWAPLILNIILNRDNLELIALMVLCDYTLDNFRINICDIIEIKIERDVQYENFKKLDGSDIKEPDTIDTLELKNVQFEYESTEHKEPVIFNVENVVLEKGKRYHVTGASGEGKSSLANLIIGAIHPTKGEVKPLKTYYVPADDSVLNDTLKNNITLGDDRVTDEEIIEVMKAVDMYDWFTEQENGFETMLGERGARLSSGLKNRLNLVRTVIFMRLHHEENYIYLLDEITANLNAEKEEIAIHAIDRECNDTLITISHHGSFDQICEHHIVVKNHNIKMID